MSRKPHILVDPPLFLKILRETPVNTGLQRRYISQKGAEVFPVSTKVGIIFAIDNIYVVVVK